MGNVARRYPIRTFEESLKDDIKNLPPAERIKTWLAMQQYLLPKFYAEKMEKEQNDEPQKVQITKEIVYRALSEKEIETGEWKNGTPSAGS